MSAMFLKKEYITPVVRSFLSAVLFVALRSKNIFRLPEIK
jgi:hypothetical protein